MVLPKPLRPGEESPALAHKALMAIWWVSSNFETRRLQHNRVSDTVCPWKDERKALLLTKTILPSGCAFSPAVLVPKILSPVPERWPGWAFFSWLMLTLLEKSLLCAS